MQGSKLSVRNLLQGVNVRDGEVLAGKFLAATGLYALLPAGNQDVAVSFASASFSVLAVLAAYLLLATSFSVAMPP